MPTPAEVANLTGVHVNTIRNWSRDYAPLLSTQARGDDGPRLFDDDDIATIRTIAALRRTGMQPAEIVARIAADHAPPVVDAYNETTPSPQAAPDALQSTALVLSSVQHAHNALHARVERLERTQDTLVKAAMLRGAIWGAVAALAVGAFYLWVLYLLL